MWVGAVGILEFVDGGSEESLVDEGESDVFGALAVVAESWLALGKQVSLACFVCGLVLIHVRFDS